MKFNRHILLIACFLLLNTSVVYAQPTQITGKDWIVMSQEDKSALIFSAIETLQKNGVGFTRSIKDYVAMIDSSIAGNPELFSSDVRTIFSFIVYKTEPEARKVLNKVMNIPTATGNR